MYVFVCVRVYVMMRSERESLRYCENVNLEKFVVRMRICENGCS